MTAGSTLAGKPFAPTIYTPEKRVHVYTLRLTDAERELLERAAEKQGLTPPNLIRQILAAGLFRKRKR